MLKGEEEVLEASYLGHYESSKDTHRTFCGRCGTHLTFHFAGEREVSKKAGWGLIFDVSAGTLDRECLAMEGFKATRQSWLDEGIPWVKDLLKYGEKSLFD